MPHGAGDPARLERCFRAWLSQAGPQTYARRDREGFGRAGTLEDSAGGQSPTQTPDERERPRALQLPGPKAPMPRGFNVTNARLPPQRRRADAIAAQDRAPTFALLPQMRRAR